MLDNDDICAYHQSCFIWVTFALFSPQNLKSSAPMLATDQYEIVILYNKLAYANESQRVLSSLQKRVTLWYL